MYIKKTIEELRSLYSGQSEFLQAVEDVKASLGHRAVDAFDFFFHGDLLD